MDDDSNVIRRSARDERLWTLRNGADFLRAELCANAEFGATLRFSRNDEFLLARRFDDDSVARREADAVRAVYERLGWVAV